MSSFNDKSPKADLHPAAAQYYSTKSSSQRSLRGFLSFLITPSASIAIQENSSWRVELRAVLALAFPVILQVGQTCITSSACSHMHNGHRKRLTESTYLSESPRTTCCMLRGAVRYPIIIRTDIMSGHAHTSPDDIRSFITP